MVDVSPVATGPLSVESRLQALLAGHIGSGALAGAVAVLFHRGRTLLVTEGMADIASATPMQPDTLFRIASMTKPVTAAAALLLVDDGRLALEDPVQQWLPELADRRVLREIGARLDDTVRAERPITVRDLLTFRAGIGVVMAPPGTWPIQQAMEEAGLMPGAFPPAMKPDEYMRRIGKLPLLHQPGSAWDYHHASDLLGVLVSRVTQMPFDNFVAKRLFIPLGMQDTAFHVPPQKLSRLSTGYAPGAQPGSLEVADDPRDSAWAKVPAFPSGGGGLISTAADYLAFCRMLLDGGGTILSRPAVREMLSDQLTQAQKDASPFYPGFWTNRGWGFGGEVTTTFRGNRRQYGWTGGFGTTFFIESGAQAAAILLTQRRMTSPVPLPVARDFAKFATEAIAAR